MNGPCNEFLARPGFTLDQHARIGLRNQIDLLQHACQCRTMANDVSKIACFDHLFTQVVPFQFQLAAKLVDLLKSAAIADRNRGVGGKRTQPIERALIRMHP